MGKGSVLIVQLFAVCVILICASATETTYAFSARVMTGGANLLRNETIVFSDVITNSGNAYDRYTGVYTCPISGLYLFMVTIVDGLGLGMQAELIAGGEIQMYTYSAGLSSAVRSGSNTVLLHLNADDQVYVRAHHEAFVVGGRSTFSGLLIQGI